MASGQRLGDIIDDFCTRCRGLTNHSIVALVDGTPARTECRTCFTAHKYRHAQGAKKQPSTKQDLFDAVLDKIGPLGHR